MHVFLYYVCNMHIFREQRSNLNFHGYHLTLLALKVKPWEEDLLIPTNSKIGLIFIDFFRKYRNYSSTLMPFTDLKKQLTVEEP